MTKFLVFLWAMFIPCLALYAQDETTDAVGEETNDTAVVSPMAKVATASLNELDVNGDGVLSASDVVDIVLYVRGKARAEFKKDKADFNGDGVVDLEDAKVLSLALTGGEIPVAAPDPEPAENPTVMRGDSVADPIGPQKQ